MRGAAGDARAPRTRRRGHEPLMSAATATVEMAWSQFKDHEGESEPQSRSCPREAASPQQVDGFPSIPWRISHASMQVPVPLRSHACMFPFVSPRIQACKRKFGHVSPILGNAARLQTDYPDLGCKMYECETMWAGWPSHGSSARWHRWGQSGPPLALSAVRRETAREPVVIRHAERAAVKPLPEAT